MNSLNLGTVNQSTKEFNSFGPNTLKGQLHSIEVCILKITYNLLA